MVSWVPGAPPGGPWGQNNPPPQSARGGVPGQFRCLKLWCFRCRFLVGLGSILGAFWGSFLVRLAPWSAKVGLKTVFEPSYHPKSNFSRNVGRRNVWSVFRGSREHPKRPKIGPRQVQDRLGTVFFNVDLLLRFLILLGPFGYRFEVPKGAPGVE